MQLQLSSEFLAVTLATAQLKWIWVQCIWEQDLHPLSGNEDHDIPAPAGVWYCSSIGPIGRLILLVVVAMQEMKCN